MPSLINRAQEFIVSGGDEYSLLRSCLEDGSNAALLAVQMIAEDMYGGHTYNYELKAPAAYCLAAFGEHGFDALVETATRAPYSKNVSLCIQVLSWIASGGESSLEVHVSDAELKKMVRAKLEGMNGIAMAARSKLRAYILSIPKDEDALQAVGSKLSYPSDISTAREVFAAFAARWLTISRPKLSAYQRLIKESSDNEPEFQTFFEEYPQLLDPMAAEVWTKPDLVGAREPDFVIRRTDNTYLIVEIETPSKPIMTVGNRLTSYATHAIAQATDYRGFLVQRFPTASAYFPRFSEPDCLVVIGLEGNLTLAQREALASDNRSRSRLQTVGFDWIAERAEAVLQNVIEARPTTRKLRVV